MKTPKHLPKTGHRDLTLALIVVLPALAMAAPKSVYYRYSIVAEAPGSFTGFEQRTSINDNGQVGFVGQLSSSGTSFESVYRGDGSIAPALLSPGFSAANRDFSGFIQINNSGEVVARDRVQGVPILTFIRKWSGSFTTVARSGVSPNNFDSVNIPNVNNVGEVSYVGLKSSPNVAEVHLSTASGDLAVATYTGLFSPRPMLADTGEVVYRDPNSRIVIWDPTGTSVRVIASTNGPFTFLGDSPGISDDGRIVGFIGDRGHGVGVFISIAVGGNPPLLVRVAGENQAPPPVTPDLGYDAAGVPIQFAALDSSSRVGVLRLPASPSGNPGERIVVCFIGTPTRAKSVVTGDPDAFTENLGIWSARLDLQTSPSIQTILHPAIPVVQIGDSIGTRVITGLAIHDPIAKAVIDDSENTCPPTRPDHWVAFWASTAGGQFIARATPFPIVIYPPIRQGNPRWGAQRYAPKQVDAYLNSLPPADPERIALEAALPNISLRQKGCAMSSYAMCLNVLLDSMDITTSSVHERFKERLTSITKTTITTAMDSTRAGQMSGILKWKPAGTMNVPVFNGADLLHSDVWSAFRVDGTITDDGIDHTITDDVAELVEANRQGHPVLLNVNKGGHWVASKGIVACDAGSPLFDVVDPARSDGSLDGPKTAETLKLAKGVILKRRIIFPPSEPAPAPFRTAVGETARVSMQTEGAVHLVITRPGGERIGYDSLTGTYYNEIPGGTYSPEFPISDPDNHYDEAEASAFMDYVPRAVQFTSQVDELLTIAVTANLTGPFAIHVDGSTGSDFLARFVVRGFLTANSFTNLTIKIETPAPPLFIAATSANTITVAWSVACPSCELESASDLDGAWSDVTAAPSASGTNYTVTLPSTGPHRFYRLAK